MYQLFFLSCSASTPTNLRFILTYWPPVSKKHKAKRRKEVFPHDLEKAYQMGVGFSSIIEGSFCFKN